MSGAIDDIFSTLEETFKGFPIEWKKYAKETKRIYNYASHTFQGSGDKIIKNQKLIVDMMRRVRFEGLDAARANRNISYRQRQIEAIFESIGNTLAWETARAWNEMTKVLINLIVGGVKGLLSSL